MADVDMPDASDVRRRGRGFRAEEGAEATPDDFSSTVEGAAGNAARSIEGWIIICTNVHEEASEEDVTELFADYGKVMNLHLNLDRRTGYVKGYALVEYATKTEAESAIKGTNGTEFLEQTIATDFAFVKAPADAAAIRAAGGNRGAVRNGAGGGRRGRSLSPVDRV